MRPRLILLHSPFLGPEVWSPVADVLRARGGLAETPAWPRLTSHEGEFYQGLAHGLAARVASSADPVVFVAHSGAGPLIPALEAVLGWTARGVIFADALLPHPKHSWMDTAPTELATQLRNGAEFGLLPSWDQWWPPGALERLVPDATLRAALLDPLEEIPLAFLEEPAPPEALSLPAAYLQLSGAYGEEARGARAEGWPVMGLPLHHLAMLTEAETVAAAIAGLADKLLEAQRG